MSKSGLLNEDDSPFGLALPRPPKNGKPSAKEFRALSEKICCVEGESKLPHIIKVGEARPRQWAVTPKPNYGIGHADSMVSNLAWQAVA